MQLTATPSTGLEKTGKDTLCNPARSHGNLRTAIFKLALLSPCQHCCVFMFKHKDQQMTSMLMKTGNLLTINENVPQYLVPVHIFNIMCPFPYNLTVQKV